MNVKEVWKRHFSKRARAERMATQLREAMRKQRERGEVRTQLKLMSKLFR